MLCIDETSEEDVKKILKPIIRKVKSQYSGEVKQKLFVKTELFKVGLLLNIDYWVLKQKFSEHEPEQFCDDVVSKWLESRPCWLELHNCLESVYPNLAKQVSKQYSRSKCV